MNKKAYSRNDIIIRYNVLGIVINFMLAISKIIIGSLYQMQALILDGVNGFSDVLSYFLTIFSSLLNKKGAGKDLPLGYGRMEYLLSFTATLAVMYVGLQSIVNSIRDMFDHNESHEYGIPIIIIAVSSLFIKLIYGYKLRKKGNELKSLAMRLSGTDSIFDAMVSLAILAAMFIYKVSGIDIEDFLCVLISILIVLTGVKMLRECMNKILGTRVDPAFKKQIVNMVLQEKQVHNVSNLVIHNYGENVYVGSLDIEVDPNMKAITITELSRVLIRKAEELGLKLTSIGVNASNISDVKADEIYDRVIEKAKERKSIIRIHSFSIDPDKKLLSFYIVLDYAIKDKEKEKEEFLKEIQELYPQAKIEIYIGVDL